MKYAGTVVQVRRQTDLHVVAKVVTDRPDVYFMLMLTFFRVRHLK